MEGPAAMAASKSATDPSTLFSRNLVIPVRTSVLGSAAAAAAMAAAPSAPAASRPPANARLPPAAASSARLRVAKCAVH